MTSMKEETGQNPYAELINAVAKLSKYPAKAADLSPVGLGRSAMFYGDEEEEE